MSSGSHTSKRLSSSSNSSSKSALKYKIEDIADAVVSVNPNIKEISANILYRFIGPYITRRSYNTAVRIQYSKFIMNFIKDIPRNICLVQDGNMYKLHDKITLSTQIGSKSAIGIVYKSTTKNNVLFRIATKLMGNDEENEKEIHISNLVSNAVLTNKNPHFVITYGYYNCNVPNSNTQTSVIDILNNNYFIFLNELASGDIISLLEGIKQGKIKSFNLYNFIFQIFISLYSFHNLGYIHGDAHVGNFLYHKVKNGDYVYYKINGKNIYVKNTGYLWMIWDFGFSFEKDEDLTNQFKEDFNEILTSLHSKYNRIIPEEDKEEDFLEFLDNLLYKLLDVNNEREYIDFFIEELIRMQPYTVSTKNDVEKTLLNSRPYVIG